MDAQELTILLADDDLDDGIFFKEALGELKLKTHLDIVNDGVALMEFLNSSGNELPDLLFLDLNMPMKSGVECLSEIKSTPALQDVPVIIFTTSMDINVVNSLYEKGALHYIRKPGDFFKLKKVIQEALHVTSSQDYARPSLENFILQP